jgi:hypothetical protein
MQKSNEKNDLVFSRVKLFENCPSVNFPEFPELFHGYFFWLKSQVPEFSMKIIPEYSVNTVVKIFFPWKFMNIHGWKICYFQELFKNDCWKSTDGRTEHIFYFELSIYSSSSYTTDIYMHGYEICLTHINNKRIFFRLREIWNIFSRNMIKWHIFSRAGTASENMWHFIMLSENIYHISRKTKK